VGVQFFPQTKIQLCIVHMVRNSLKYVSWKDYKAITAELKQIYKASTEDAALLELERFGEKWDEQYPQISKSWHNHWPNLITLFEYPPDIRRVIYTTNAIESLNSVIRKATKQRKVFPTDDSAEGGLSGNSVSGEEMDHADPQLEACPEPLYDRLR
jgi:putative transposase